MKKMNHNFIVSTQIESIIIVDSHSKGIEYLKLEERLTLRKKKYRIMKRETIKWLSINNN